MRLRFGTRFSVIIAGAAGVAVALAVCWFFYSARLLGEQHLQQRGEDLGRLVVLLAPQLTGRDGQLRFDELIRDSARRQPIVFAVLIDSRGNFRSSYINRDISAVRGVLRRSPDAGERQLLMQLRSGEGVLPLEFPLLDKQRQPGYFLLGLSTAQQPLLDTAWFWQTVLVVIALLLTIAAVAMRAVRICLLSPLVRLTEAAGRLSEGRRRRLDEDHNPELSALVGAFNGVIDSMEQKQALLRHQANHDALTALPNRMMAFDRLQHEVNRAARDSQKVAVIFIDLDDFKTINDTLGHAAGDQLLVEIGRRLVAELRVIDTVARLGGDEFLVLLPEAGGENQVEQVAERLVRGLSRPLQLNGREVVVHSSLGIALYPDDGPDVDTLMANADNAMYQAKVTARSSICFFTREMNVRIRQRLLMEQDLGGALQRNELELRFQPMVESASGKHRGAEVLLFWRHPQRGLLTPEQFIPVAEATGLIVEISQWMLREVARCWAQWSQAGLDPGFMSLNISANLFHEHLCWRIGEVLAHYRLPPAILQLEITESVLLDDHQQVTEELNELRAMGLRLALDDFGSGFSSLSHLKRYRFDALKIAPAFISGLPENADEVSLVRAIIAMAKGLELGVVANGVANWEQVSFLAALGCECAQGSLIAPPVDEFCYRSWLESSGQGGDFFSLTMPSSQPS